MGGFSSQYQGLSQQLRRTRTGARDPTYREPIYRDPIEEDPTTGCSSQEATLNDLFTQFQAIEYALLADRCKTQYANVQQDLQREMNRGCQDERQFLQNTGYIRRDINELEACQSENRGGREGSGGNEDTGGNEGSGGREGSGGNEDTGGREGSGGENGDTGRDPTYRQPIDEPSTEPVSPTVGCPSQTEKLNTLFTQFQRIEYAALTDRCKDRYMSVQEDLQREMNRGCQDERQFLQNTAYIERDINEMEACQSEDTGGREGSGGSEESGGNEGSGGSEESGGENGSNGSNGDTGDVQTAGLDVGTWVGLGLAATVGLGFLYQNGYLTGK